MQVYRQGLILIVINAQSLVCLTAEALDERMTIHSITVHESLTYTHTGHHTRKGGINWVFEHIYRPAYTCSLYRYIRHTWSTV